MSCWTSRKVNYACTAAVLFLLFLGKGPEALPLYILATLILVANVIQTVIYYRCPHCGHLLPLRGRSFRLAPRYCPYCGKEMMPPGQDRDPRW